MEDREICPIFGRFYDDPKGFNPEFIGSPSQGLLVFSKSVGSSDVPLLLLNYLNIEKPLGVRLRILGPTDVMSFI